MDPTLVLRTCPYNASHQIRVSRFQYHLVKCKKNYPHMNLKTCPFNATHLVKDEDFKNHLVYCPDATVVSKKLDVDNQLKGNTSVPAYNAYTLPDMMECWDSDSDSDDSDDVESGMFRANGTSNRVSDYDAVRNTPTYMYEDKPSSTQTKPPPLPMGFCATGPAQVAETALNWSSKLGLGRGLVRKWELMNTEEGSKAPLVSRQDAERILRNADEIDGNTSMSSNEACSVPPRPQSPCIVTPHRAGFMPPAGRGSIAFSNLLRGLGRGTHQ